MKTGKFNRDEYNCFCICEYIIRRRENSIAIGILCHLVGIGSIAYNSNREPVRNRGQISANGVVLKMEKSEKYIFSLINNKGVR